MALLAFVAASISLSRSLSSTTIALPSICPSSITIGLPTFSAASTSASPHVQPLQAFFRRGAEELNGSQVGTGRARSVGCKRDVGSIVGVDVPVEGALKAHRAAFCAFLFRLGSATDLGSGAPFVIVDSADFCAYKVDGSAEERTSKPASLSSGLRAPLSTGRLESWRVPKGPKLAYMYLNKSEARGIREMYSSGERTICAAVKAAGLRVDAVAF